MGRNGQLRDMRKRRVGVTARSWLIVENQATGTPQIASEIAAPLVSRTPMGTVATATTECGWKRGDTTGAKANRAESRFSEMDANQQGSRKWRERGRAGARMRRCLILRQGDKPPETPAPLSLRLQSPERKESVKGSQAAHKTRALDRFLPFPKFNRDEGKGGAGKDPFPASLRVGPGISEILAAPNISLDRGGPSHGSPDREEGVASIEKAFRPSDRIRIEHATA